MELIIDEGNTTVKIAVFENNGIKKVFREDSLRVDIISDLAHNRPEATLFSSTRKESTEKLELLKGLGRVHVLTHHTPLPVRNMYDTPQTLGKDRIAAVIGARFLVPEGPVLSIDAGTCITFDLLTKDDEYLGGKISPGAEIRFKAMNDYTGNLPLLDPQMDFNMIGTSTDSSIIAGVMHGMTGEINQTIEDYSSRFDDLNVVLTGGDAAYFVNHIKKKIFANQNLVLLGLHKILKFNEKA